MLISHPKPLYEARFIARYDRFIAEVSLGGKVVDAHCVNTGRMEGLIRPGCRAWVSQVPPESTRKLRYTLEMLEIGDTIIGVNTQIPNLLAETVVRKRQVPGLKRFSELKREVRYGENSRVDLLLKSKRNEHYVEVKNCHLVYPDGGAYFPDSVSARATGHLRELSQCVSQGQRATVLFIVQRDDARFVAPSDLHDPEFAAAAREAARKGVRFKAVQFAPSIEGFRFLRLLPVRLAPYSTKSLRQFKEAEQKFSGWKRRGKRSAPTT